MKRSTRATPEFRTFPDVFHVDYLKQRTTYKRFDDTTHDTRRVEISSHAYN